MLSGNRIFALTGFSLIAASYGLARFSWGLMLPDIITDMRISLSLAGTLSACSFAAYCVGILYSTLYTSRTGPRFPALLAGVFAMAGMTALALSHSALLLALGCICAGLSSGLVSPPLAEAVKRKVAKAQQPVVNTVINAGTGGGIILSALTVFVLTDNWRTTYLLFTLFALIPTLSVLKTVPTHADDHPASLRQNFSVFLQPAIRPALGVALLSGIASAAYWSFGPVMFQSLAGIEGNGITLAWLVTGLTGCAGMFTGQLTNHIGINKTHRLMQILTVVAFVLLIFSTQMPLLAWLSAAVYGFTYISLSGVLLLSGVKAVAATPAAGLGAVFLMLAAGQVVGSAAFGLLLEHTGAVTALLVFSGVTLMAMMMRATPTV